MNSDETRLRAEIISIGDELTTGNRLDTNSQWLSQQLGNLGIQAAYHTTVGDTYEDNIRVFRNAADRADIIVSTGGLGPTADDLTRQCIAEAFELPLETRPEALQHIENLFSKRNRPMPERNRVQALFPATSRIIDNPHGTAPGIDLVLSAGSQYSERGCRLFSLPGVPAEMKEMFSQTIEPRLTSEMGAGKTRWFYRSLKVYGLGESDVEQQLPDLIARDRIPLVGITASKATITLRIAAQCQSQDEFDTLAADTVQSIYDKLGLLVFGEGDVDLDAVVAKLLSTKQKRVGVIECGSGVWMTHALTQFQLASSTFGVQANRWLPGVPEETVEAWTARVGPIAQTMLDQSLLTAAPLNCVVALGSYPDRDEVARSSGLPSTLWKMMLVRPNREIKVTSLVLGAHPEVLYPRLAKTGMNFLRLELLAHD
jgi:nicotinamide-nucleotide amidase